MRTPITITATLPAWLPPFNSVTHLLDNIRKGNQQAAAETLHFTRCEMDKSGTGWSRVGEAELTIRLVPQDEMVAAQVRALESELSAARAEWLAKQQEILDRISKMKAIEYVEAA